MYKKILVPLDGSKTAEGILPHVKALAYSEGAEIIILNVATNPAHEFAFSDPAIAGGTVAEQAGKAREYTNKICSELKAEGFKGASYLREGSPATTIIGTAEELDVDVIAMSTHGRSWPSKWLLGSVAERVVRHSKKPVLMIRVA